MEIIEKEFFILKIDETNKNYRKYPQELVQKWIDSCDDYGYELEYSVNMNSKDIQYEFIKSDLVCGVVYNLFIKDNSLFGKVKFFKEGFKGNEIYSNSIDLENCVLIPKGKAEVREGIVQNNYKLFGFNLVDKQQSSFVY